MAIAQFIEGTAFGVFNDILSAFHTNEGYALPNRYEVVIIPPAKVGVVVKKTYLITQKEVQM